MCFVADIKKPLHNISIYTPVKLPSLKTCLEGYHDATFIRTGFANGFSLAICNKPVIKAVTKIFHPKKNWFRK